MHTSLLDSDIRKYSLRRLTLATVKEAASERMYSAFSQRWHENINDINDIYHDSIS